MIIKIVRYSMYFFISISLIFCAKEQKQIEKKGNFFASIEEKIDDYKTAEFLLWEPQSKKLEYNKPLLVSFNKKITANAFKFLVNSGKTSSIQLTYKSGKITEYESKILSHQATETTKTTSHTSRNWNSAIKIKKEPGSEIILVITSSMSGSILIELRN